MTSFFICLLFFFVIVEYAIMFCIYDYYRMQHRENIELKLEIESLVKKVDYLIKINSSMKSAWYAIDNIKK